MAFIAPALCVLLSFIISSTAAESSLTPHRVVHPRELDSYDLSQVIARTGHSSMFF
jgi:hypothetical protein